MALLLFSIIREIGGSFWKTVERHARRFTFNQEKTKKDLRKSRPFLRQNKKRKKNYCLATGDGGAQLIISYFVFLFQQLHSLEGEAVQMRRLRQRFLPVADVGRPPHSALGGVAAQVPSLCPQLQPAIQPQDASPHPHGLEAVRVLVVRQSLPTQLRFAPPRPDSRRRRCGHRKRKQRHVAPFARIGRQVVGQQQFAHQFQPADRLGSRT